jgi:hypothetical protein
MGSAPSPWRRYLDRVNDDHWGWLFRQFINQEAPDVLRELAGEPFDRICRVPVARLDRLYWDDNRGVSIDEPPDDGLLLAGTTTTLRNWAERWHTPELASWGLRQIVEWRHRGQADPSRWAWATIEIVMRPKVEIAPFTFTYDPAKDDQSYPDRIAEFARRTFEEELERYLAPLRDEWRRWEALQPKRPRPRRKYFADEHMRWLVRYQVLNESMSSIARSASCHRQTVADALEDCASLVGIELRLPNFRTRRKAG